MANDTLVSEEFAKKFATEKETPYTRWVRAEGLDIISSFYVPNLHTVELHAPRWSRCLPQSRRVTHVQRLLRL